MLTKKEFIEFAAGFNWTKADAERAWLVVESRHFTNREDMAAALLFFAGPELAERQRLQAAQKGQVTKKTRYFIHHYNVSLLA